MVVGPASTLDRWKNEFAKWAPSMDAIVYRAQVEDRVDMLGPFLPLPGQGDTGKILITSYEMVIRDMKYLKRCAWKFVILDEGPPTLLMNEGAPSARPHAAPPCPRLILTPPAAAHPTPCRTLGPHRPLTHSMPPLHRGLLRPSAQEHELQARQGAQGHLRRQPGAAVQPAAAHGHAAAEPDRALVAAQLYLAE